MDAQFPLFTGTYSINGRKYRKTAYQLKVATCLEDTIQKVEQFEDTPDVYEDEPSAGCLAPPGLPALKKKIAKSAKQQPEVSSKQPESNTPEPTEDERVKVIGGKKWIASISVPACFIGKLIGMNRRALATLENDTQCRVKTPRRDEDKPLEITSFVSLECVQRCLDRIEIFVDDARKTARVTHFVAFPCDQHDVQENYEIFKQLIMDSEHFDASCKNPQLFTKPTRLHLTLSVVRIFDDVDFQKVKEAFATVEKEIQQITGSSKLIADIQGIDMMNDDPSQVSVIYAKVQGEKIQAVANHVNRRLVELGFAKNEQPGEDVKLHMTLMNARYASQAERTKKTTFDAKKVLEDLKDSYFGTFQLTEICLCPLNSSTSAEKFYDKLVTMKLA